MEASITKSKGLGGGGIGVGNNGGLSGHDLLGFIRALTNKGAVVDVGGIDLHRLRGVQFSFETLGQIIDPRKKITINFPANISDHQIKDVFSDPALRDLERNKEETVVTVRLWPLSDLGLPVIGRPEEIEGISLTSKAAKILARAPLIIIGRDAPTELLHQCDWLAQNVGSTPLQLGRQLDFSWLVQGFDKINRPEIIIHLLKEYFNDLCACDRRLPARLLDKLAGFMENDNGKPLARLLGDIISLNLREEHLLQLFKSLADHKYFPAFALLEARCNKLTPKTALYIADIYKKIGSYKAARLVLYRTEGNKEVRSAEAEIRKLIKREEASRIKEGEVAFLKLLRREISLETMLMLLPNDLDRQKGIETCYIDELVGYLQWQITPEIYLILQNRLEEHQLFSALHQAAAREIYFKVKNGALPLGGKQEQVLDLILKEDLFYPDLETMDAIARRAVGNGKRPYPPAAKVYKHFFQADMEAAQKMATAGNTAAALERVERVLAVWPGNPDAMIWHIYHSTMTGDYQRPIELFLGFAQNEKIKEKLLSNSDFLTSLGACYLLKYKDLKSAADLNEAIQYLEKSRKLKLDSPKNLFNLALAYAWGNKLALAAQYLNRRLVLDKSQHSFVGFMDELIATGDLSPNREKDLTALFELTLAEVKVGRSIIADPALLSRVILIAMELMAKGFTASVEVMLKKAAGEKNAKLLLAYAQGALANDGKKDWKGVFAAMEPLSKSGSDLKIYTILSDHPETLRSQAAYFAMNALRNLYQQDSILEGELRAKSEQLTAQAPSAITYNLLGNIYGRLGDLVKAGAAFRQAEAHDQFYIFNCLNLIEFYAEMKEDDNYQKALKALPEKIRTILAQKRSRQFENSIFWRALQSEATAHPSPIYDEVLALLKAAVPLCYERFMGEKK